VNEDPEAAVEALAREATTDEEDDDGYWIAVHAVYAFGRQVAAAHVSSWRGSADPRLRTAFVDVVACPGQSDAEKDEALTWYRELLAHEDDARVVAAVGFALNHIGAPLGSLDLMLPFAAHPNADVRNATVLVCGAWRSDARAVTALVAATRDASATVRDWATFELGSQGEPGDADFIDTPEVREALAARLDDEHDDTRGEAMVALAMRRDARATPAIARALAEGFCGPLILEAARWAADASLEAPLRAIEHDDARMSGFETYERDQLQEALTACRDASPR
jgi:HEAT repeat protein